MNKLKDAEQNKTEYEKLQWEKKYGKNCNTCQFTVSMGEYERECRFCILNKSLKLRWKANDQYIKDWVERMDEIDKFVIKGIETQSTKYYNKINEMLGRK